jgi:hypothetical protein
MKQILNNSSIYYFTSFLSTKERSIISAQLGRIRNNINKKYLTPEFDLYDIFGSEDEFK